MVGAYGQVGQELFRVLSGRIGVQNVICTDIKEPPSHLGVVYHYNFDVLDKETLYKTIQNHHFQAYFFQFSFLSFEINGFRKAFKISLEQRVVNSLAGLSINTMPGMVINRLATSSLRAR